MSDQANTSTIRPRRSVLYMPAANARALEKARGLPADALIFDLEDAVAPGAKEVARAQAVAAANSGHYGRREIIIRINGLETPWGVADLAAVANSQAAAVLLPKIEQPGQIQTVAETLARQPGTEDMKIWCMIETPLGVLQAREIAAASSRLECLVMGTSDLLSDLRARPTPDRAPLLPALSHCLLVARAQGLCILDGVHLDLADDAGFRAACQQGQDMGFDGKTLIHPSQIAPANDVFAPDGNEVAQAKRIIAAHDEAAQAGKGVAVLDGKLVENLHVAAAQRTLSLALAIEGRIEGRIEPHIEPLQG